MKNAATLLCSLATATLVSAAPVSLDENPELTRQVALGVAAKRLCSSMFISGRSAGNVKATELEHPLLASVEYDIGDDYVAVSLGDNQARAIYRGPLGCTLIEDAAEEELRSKVDLDKLVALDSQPRGEWPLGNEVTIPEEVSGIDLEAVNAAVDKAFEDMVPNQNIRTRAALVIYKGKIIAERYAEPFNADMAQLGWSMTKTLTGTLVGMMEKDGYLDRQDHSLLPLWQGEDDPRADITLEHLLHMSSGLPFAELGLPTMIDDSALMLYTAGDTAHFAADRPLEDEPATLWVYSSGTSNIISKIMRQEFDSYADYLNYPRERLFQRLGMNSAVLEPDAVGTYVGSSYLWATPRDWAKLGLLYLQDGVWNGERILPEGWVEYATTPAPAAPKGTYGAQIWLNAGEEGNPADRPHPELPASMYYLSGFEGQNVVVFPEQDLIVVRMGLTVAGPRPVWKLSEEVIAALR